MVTLIDGTQAGSNSEAFRHECEARSVAALPTLAERRAYLDGVREKRGEEEARRLEATVRALWATVAKPKSSAVVPR